VTVGRIGFQPFLSITWDVFFRSSEGSAVIRLA